jgi:hypothetical protein
MLRSFATWALCLSSAIAAPASEKRLASSPVPPELTVDLNYAVYTGYADSTSGLNVWKGYVFLLGEGTTCVENASYEMGLDRITRQGPFI